MGIVAVPRLYLLWGLTLWMAVWTANGYCADMVERNQDGKYSLELGAKMHDFGILPPDRSTFLTHDFPIRNRGTKPVRILSIGTACRTMAECPVKILLPKQSSFVRVMTSLPTDYTKDGNFSRQIRVKTDDPHLPEFELGVLAHFQYTVKWTPSEIDFGLIASGESVVQTGVVVTSLSTQSLKVRVLGYDKSLYSIDQISTKCLSYEQGKGRERFLPSILCRCRINEKLPEGPFLDTLVLGTNHADIPEIRIPVSGKVAPLILIEPEDLFLGIVSQKDIIQKSIHLSSALPDFAVKKVVSPIKGLHSITKKTPKGYIVNLTYQPTGYSGIIEDQITIYTNIASAQIVQVKVMGLVK